MQILLFYHHQNIPSTTQNLIGERDSALHTLHTESRKFTKYFLHIKKLEYKKFLADGPPSP